MHGSDRHVGTCRASATPLCKKVRTGARIRDSNALRVAGDRAGARGWGHSTIRAMLRNERYIGRWTWNASKWVSHPLTGKRRRVPRPRSEHRVRDVPELAIIERELWECARARLRTQTASRGRTPGVGKWVYLVSGLLRCGTCGSSMSVVGQRTKNGVRYATLGCGTHNSRGDAICDNALTISEKRITTALIESLR